jgi:signal peptidase II
MRATSRESFVSRGLSLSSEKAKWALFLGIAALVLIIDQVSKRLVLRNLSLGEEWNPIPFLRPLVSVTHVTNTGAAFGLFKDHGTLFAFVAILVVVGILIFYRFSPSDETWLRVSLGLQLGGALGNLWDRVRLGSVVDFIDFKIWPVFNLADTAIVVGVAILAFYLLFIEQEDGERVESHEGVGQD